MPNTKKSQVSFNASMQMDIFFIRPGAGEQDSNLQRAFQMCVKNRCNPEWIDSQDCKDINTTGKLFVMSPFDGEGFEMLKTRGAKLVGPSCVLTCIATCEPIPELPYPLFTTSMKDLIVTTTNVDKAMRKEVERKVQLMSGIYSTDLHDGCTHVVTEAVGSDKYRIAAKKGIPVMSMKWVNEVWKTGQSHSVHATDAQFVKMTCPVFKGLIICISQVDQKARESLRNVITENGGCVEGQLFYNKTNVLVVPKPTGDKYKHAKKWKIPCVYPEWVHSCVQRGYSVISKTYEVNIERIIPKSSTPEHSLCAYDANETLGSTIYGPAECTRIEDTVAPSDASTIVPSIVDRPLAYSRLSIAEAKCSESCLSGCKIYLLGFSASDKEHIHRFITASGAMRLNQLTQSVTHVVVEDGVKDIQTVQEQIPHAEFVTCNWLAECIRQKQVCKTRPFDIQHPDDETTACLKENTIQENIGNPEPGNDETTEINMDVEEHRETTIATNCEFSSTNNFSSTIKNGPLKDMSFNILGFSGEQQQELELKIMELGGTIKKCEESYAVVPLLGFSETIVAVKKITELWVEECFVLKEAVPFMYYHFPIPTQRNAGPLSGCVIVCSRYTDYERIYIRNLIEALGAIFQESLAKVGDIKKGIRAATHLVCEDPTGKKYEFAKKWGMPTVQVKWLLACANKCARVDEKLYPPGEELGDTTDESIVEVAPTQKTHLRVKIDTPISHFRELFNMKKYDVATPPPEFGKFGNHVASPSTRKGWKTWIDSIPDFKLDITPEFKRQKLEFPCFTELKLAQADPGTTATRTSVGEKNSPSKETGYLSDVVLYVSKKLSTVKQELHDLVIHGSGKYQMTYSGAVTHFVYQDKYDAADPEIQQALQEGKIIVTEAWLRACVCSKMFVSENLYKIANIPEFSQRHDLMTNSTEKTAMDTVLEDNCTITTAATPVMTRDMEKLQSFVNSSSPKKNTSAQKQAFSESFSQFTSSVAAQNLSTSTATLEKHSLEIKWEDSQEFSAREHLLNNGVPAKKFMLSSMADEDLRKYETIIRKLGGTFIGSTSYDSSMTHLVVNRITRSEKVLSCIASGKWILPTVYLDDSLISSKFLQEEIYELGNPRCSQKFLQGLDDTGRKFAKMAYMWRINLNRTRQKGAFVDMIAVIYTSEERIGGIKRLIKSGGGTVRSRNENLSDVTHCFIEINKIDMGDVDLNFFVKNNIPCLAPVFLSEFLSGAVSIDRFLIPAYVALKTQ